MILKELKKGDMLTLKNIECPTASQVWIKGDYDRATKTYSIINYDDCNRERFIKADRVIYTNFIF